MVRKAKQVQTKINTLLFGNPFCGKSTMALQSLLLKTPEGKPMRVLYIDAEIGSVDDYLGDMEAQGAELDNLLLVYTQSITEVNEYIKKATDGDDFYVIDEDGNETDEVILDANGNPFRPDFIVVDGTSILDLTTKQSIVEFSKKRAKVKADRDGLIGDERFVKIEGGGIEIKDYQTINFRAQDLILALNGSGKHYIVTAREAEVKKSIKGKNGEIQMVSTGEKIPEGFKQIAYNVKTNIRLFRDEEDYEVVKAHVLKDRTGVHRAGAIVEDPILLDWQDAINKTSGNLDLAIRDSLDKAVSREIKAREKEALHLDEDENIAQIAPTGSLESLQLEISAKIKNLKNATDKAQAKQKLVDADLPTSPKTVTDIEVLKKILEILS